MPNAENDAPGVCPTLCDEDCEADCHQWHQPYWKRTHQPEDCPGTRVIPPAMPDPASLTPEESNRWAEALDGRPRVIPPGEGDT